MSETPASFSLSEGVKAAFESVGVILPDSDQSDLLDAGVSDATDPAQPAKPARSKKQKDVSGRALVDIPAHGLKCGDYATLPADAAEALAAAGEFDTKAAKPE